ncbi:NAD(P)/FAD-dependent oxidoreductase [bacterium]|nr:NAD(P)/FAD-dependent oxidoreductase [bacterium]
MRTLDSADAGIIGAGPAGVAAAVQLARHGVRPVVFESGPIGGLLRTAWCVENFPGFPGGVSGPDLAGLLDEQLCASGAKLVREKVASLDRDDDVLVVRTGGVDVRFRAVIVASGTRPREVTDPEIPPEARDRVFREVGELRGVRGAHVAVVGGGDAAFDYALGLSEENDVTILVRGNRTRCLPLLAARARSRERVTVRMATRVTAVARGSGRPLRLTSLSDGGDGGSVRGDLHVDYLVLAVGREPDDGFLSEELRRDAAALEVRRELLFAGDVRNGIFRQASIAAGQGTHAAMKVAAMLRDGVVAAVGRGETVGADSHGELR